MNLFDIALLAIALSFDLSGVCFASGALLHKAEAAVSLRFLFILDLTLVMLSLCGLMVGAALFAIVGEAGQWIALLLFIGTGLKIIFESLQPKTGDSAFAKSAVKTMVVLALGESINAFIITTGIGFLLPDIPKALLVISIILLLFSALWIYIGRNKGTSPFKFRLGTLGGLILVAAGLHLLIKLI